MHPLTSCAPPTPRPPSLVLIVLPVNTLASLFLIWESTVIRQRHEDQVLEKTIPGFISAAVFYLEQKKKRVMPEIKRAA